MWTSPPYSRPLGYKKTGRGGGSPLPWFGKIAVGSAGWTLSLRVLAAAQSTTLPPSKESAQEIVNQLLAFIYSIGHLIGQGFIRLITTILPSAPVPTELVDPIGLLSILTIFLVVAQVARKLTWIVVIIGWALILVRLIIVIVQSYL